HEGAVNAVVFLKDGRIATSGEDARIALWRPGDDAPMTVLTGHTAPVVSLAVSPDGKTLASAAWDHTARLWPLAGGAPRVLARAPPCVLGAAHNTTSAVAFPPDDRPLPAAEYAATPRLCPLPGAPAPPAVVTLPPPLNAVAIAPDGDIAAAGADGKVYFLPPA